MGGLRREHRNAPNGRTRSGDATGQDPGQSGFCERYSDSFNRWWDELGRSHLDEATVSRLVDGIGEVTSTTTHADLAARRDALVTAVVAATHSRS